MFSRLLRVCVLFGLATGVWAADPFPPLTDADWEELAAGLDVSPPCTVTVDGKTTAAVGQLVRLDALCGSEVSVLWHLVGGQADWWDTSNDGRTVFFAAPTAGEYRFVLAAACVVPNSPVPTLQLVEHVVTVRGPTPGPGPSPTPGPAPGPDPTPTPPKPVLPAGRFGVAQIVYDGVSTMPATDKPMVLAVSNNYSAVAAQCAAGVVGSLKGAIDRVRSANVTLFGSRRDDHLKAWGTGLAQKLAELDKAGKLATSDDWRCLLEEIALGLRTWGAN